MVILRRFHRRGEVRPPHLLPTLVLALAGTLGCGAGMDMEMMGDDAPGDTGGPPGGDPGDPGNPGDPGDPGDGGDGSGGPLAVCPPVPACDAPLPDLGPERDFRHTLSSLIVGTGFANHRGRDLLLRPGDRQFVIGKIAYGIVDKDLEDEEVDVWLLRGCGSTWEQLGTALTTEDDDHEAVEGVPDSGGRVYFEIPPAQSLGIGRHRIHLSVAGDRSGADLFIQIAPEGTALLVSDVDGTLTIGENEEFSALLQGDLPAANRSAPDALRALAGRGYLPLYLTARPEFLVGRTRDFLARNGFPPGLVHTTTDLLGAIGSDAAAFKTADLDQAVVQRGYVPAYAFGNTATDADAYDATGVQPLDSRLFFRFEDTAHGGRRFEDYGDLVDELAAAPAPCE